MAMTDAQWASLAPLVEACRPRSKRPPRDLRRTLDGILWRHRNGATWRALPAEYGPWCRSAQLFVRWSRSGAWQQLLGLAQARGRARPGAARRVDDPGAAQGGGCPQ